MDDDSEEDLLEAQNNSGEDDPLEQDGFGTYEDFEVVPDDLQEESPEEEEEESPEEEEEESPEEQIKNEVADKVKQQAKEAAKKAAQKAAKAAAKGLLAAAKALFVPPVLFITLGVIAVLLIVIIIIVMVNAIAAAEAAHYENCDPVNGVFATADGIRGDAFYGGRVVYLDPEKSNNDIKAYYEALALDFIEDVSESKAEITLKLDLENEEQIKNYTPEMVRLIAKAVANLTDVTEELTVDEYIVNIDHFGWTNLELERIQTVLVNYIKENMTNTNADGSFKLDDDIYTLAEGYDILESDLNNYFDENYDGKYNITAPLYYVKDMILSDEESMLESFNAKNIIAFIYMPKTEVTFEDTQHMFYFPDEDVVAENSENEYLKSWATNINYEFIKVDGGVEEVVYTANIDSSWWSEDYAELKTEVDIDYQLGSFASIDSENLTNLNEANLLSVLIDGSSEILVEENNCYFMVNVINNSETGEEYKEINYLPKNDVSYLYIKLQADGVYQFCEYSVNYE